VKTDLIFPPAERYAAFHSTPEDELLRSIEAHTRSEHAEPHMLSGPVQGRFLGLLSCLLAPRYILEIGTYTGYSALCLAEGLQPGGQLHTIEKREREARVARQFFNRSLKANQIILHQGSADSIIPTLEYEWDLVFIDADKPGYVDYYEQVLPRLRTNGLIIADNVLFHGQVLQSPPEGRNAAAIDAFNRHVSADARTEQVMLTVRDGLMLIRKK
jgi:predicted O-methyltransferase YrrM